jgi:hypothetical protein
MITLPARACIAIPRRRCAAGAACTRVTGCCRPQPPQPAPLPPARSPWRTRPSAPTARTRTRRKESHDYYPDFPRCVPAGRRRRGAAGPGSGWACPPTA